MQTRLTAPLLLDTLLSVLLEIVSGLEKTTALSLEVTLAQEKQLLPLLLVNILLLVAHLLGSTTNTYQSLWKLSQPRFVMQEQVPTRALPNMLVSLISLSTQPGSFLMVSLFTRTCSILGELPITLLSSTTLIFSTQIYNRWSQSIYRQRKNKKKCTHLGTNETTWGSN